MYLRVLDPQKVLVDSQPAGQTLVHSVPGKRRISPEIIFPSLQPVLVIGKHVGGEQVGPHLAVRQYCQVHEQRGTTWTTSPPVEPTSDWSRSKSSPEVVFLLSGGWLGSGRRATMSA